MGRGSYERVKKKHHAESNQRAADAYKYDEGDGLRPFKTERLDKQTGDYKDSRNAKLSAHRINGTHQLPPSQNFTLSPQRPTLWTVSWQPLEMQDSAFAFIAGNVAGSAL